MTDAFLPPISSWHFLPCAAAQLEIVRPALTEPVNETAAVSGWVISASPNRAPWPKTTLNTPAGIPASRWHSVTCQAVRGACSEGLSTTVLPKASAGAAFQIGIAIGKF